MITINYTGNSKLISRIVHLLNRKAPLPLNGDGDAVWGTNGQVLTTDGNGNTYWGDGGGGGGDVTDVEVNGNSVVNAQGVAEVSVPTDTSDLNNDSGFITNLVNDLANYYTKSQTYTQAEVNALISGIVTLNILVVQTLPTQDISTTTIYLVPKQDTGTSDIYDEYLYINNAWELIGTTQIDLSNYVTTTDLSTALADYVTSVGLATILAGYVQSSDLATVATSGSYNDLTDKPTIPTVNDGTLTIQQNGTTLGTFSANQSENTTVNLTGGGSTYTEGDGIDITNDEISVDTAFTEASTRTNIASGDTFSTILGKIKKFFTDLKTVAFTGAYSDLSGTPTIPADNSVKDYNNSTPTKFGYSTSGMAQSAATWLGAWDASVSGEYRLRAVKQADLIVASASKLGISTVGSGNRGIYLNGGTPTALSWYPNYCSISGGNTSNYPWHRFAFTQSGTGTYTDLSAIIVLDTRYDGGRFGVVKITVRTNASGAAMSANAVWFYRRGFAVGDVVISPTTGTTGTNTTFSVYVKCGNYPRTIGYLLEGANLGWTLVDSNEPNNTTSTDKKGGYEIYASVSNSKSAVDDGTVNYANSAGSANSVAWSNITSKPTFTANATVNAVCQRDSAGTIYLTNLGASSSTNWFGILAAATACKNYNNTAYAPIYASSYPGTSARRFKEKIEPMTEEEALKILDIEAVTFDYKADMGIRTEDERHGQRGVIAEQVEPIIPSVVTYEDTEDGEHLVYGVDYSKFVPYLIKMVQMQQKEIDELKAIVKATITETAEE